MSKTSTLCVLFLALARLASAQALGPIVDKAPMGAERVLYYPAELDGQVATREWVGLRSDPDTQAIWYRVATQRANGLLCEGAEFDPVALIRPTLREVSVLVWTSIRGVDHLLVQGERYYQEIAFTLPVC